ncbi:MAG: FHA domain-containing serine/threonine-protein kinase [Opitutales bacterium]
MKTPLALNTIIDKRYNVLKVLGAGGFGIAYLCQDLSLNVQVVLKECFPEPQQVGLIRQGSEIFALSQKDLESFDYFKNSAIKEAKRISAINHSHIVQIKDSILTNGTVYIVMDFVEGKGLDEIIKERQFNIDFVFNLLTSLLQALDALHSKNIFHKDLKPENIIIRKNNSPVIIDFGAARSATELKQSKTEIYSDFYSAPELRYADMTVDGRCDIFSLGVIIHEVITGKVPSLNANNKGKGLLRGSAYEKTYNKNFLASIDTARSASATDRFSSARAWVDYLKKVKVDRNINNSTPEYEARAKTKEKIELKQRNDAEQSQEDFELDAEFSLSEDNSTKLAIYVVLFIIAIIFIFTLDFEMNNKLKAVAVFFIVAVGIVPLFRASRIKSKEALSLYFAQGTEEFDFDLHLDAEPLVFGRGENADIQLSSVDKYMCVSREHFTIYYKEGEILINNLKGEENPMRINGHMVVGELSISTGVGSIFEIGNLTFRLKARE